jgi:hypothetical protein
MKSFYERVMAGQQSRKKIAIVAVARKLLSIMRAMLLTGVTFDEEFVSSLDYGRIVRHTFGGIEKLRKSA